MANKIEWYPEPIRKQVAKIEPVEVQEVVIQPIETRENLAKRMNRLLGNLIKH